MKKYFKYYFICWLAAIVAFNAITFVVTNSNVDFADLTSSFWIGYSFIMLAFVGNLLVSNIFFRKDTKDKVFLNLSIVQISYSALIISLIAGTISMTVFSIPYWIGIVADVLILAIYCIAVTNAVASAKIVESRGQEIKDETLFIKALIVDAENLKASVVNEDIKKLTNKIYEAIRYSDPISDYALLTINEEIKNEFEAFKNAVKDNDVELANGIANNLLALIDKRNKQCLNLK